MRRTGFGQFAIHEARLLLKVNHALHGGFCVHTTNQTELDAHFRRGSDGGSATDDARQLSHTRTGYEGLVRGERERLTDFHDFRLDLCSVGEVCELLELDARVLDFQRQGDCGVHNPIHAFNDQGGGFANAGQTVKDKRLQNCDFGLCVVNQSIGLERTHNVEENTGCARSENDHQGPHGQGDDGHQVEQKHKQSPLR